MSEEQLSLEGLHFETLQVEEKDHILWLTLDRPERRNAINPVMANEIIYALDFATVTPDIRVIVLRATGTIFCSGADLSVMGGGQEETTSTVPQRGLIHDISLRLRSVCKPVIVQAQGPVLAGALLFACNATHVLAAEEVTFSAPEIKRGLWPHMVMAGLFRVMPRRAALDFIMRGYKIGAAKAMMLGLVNEVVAASELDTRTDELASELAGLAPASIRMGLEAFYKQESMAFEDAIPYLMEMLTKTIGTEDAREGIMAFMEKREPIWKGK